MHEIQMALLQWQGRKMLQRSWWMLLLLRGLYHSIPSQVHQTLFTWPFIQSFSSALDAALARHAEWLPALSPDEDSRMHQREFLRLYKHNGQVIHSNPNLAGKRTSILRILTCIHADGVGFFSVLHSLLHEAGLRSEQTQMDDVHSLDNETSKRSTEMLKHIKETVSEAVSVRY